MAGRHRSRQAPRRRGRRFGAATAACLGGVAVLLAGAAWAVGGLHGCQATQPVAVTAAPDIAPALTRLIKAKLGGGCTAFHVTAAPPATTAAEIRRGRTPDVWIPDSAYWLELARGEQAVSIARSPVLLGTSRDLATKLAVMGARPSWRLLLPGSDIRKARPRLLVKFADPSRDSAALGLITIMNAVASNQGDPTKVLAPLLSSLKRSIVPDQRALLDYLAKPGDDEPVVVTSEQALFAHNTSSSTEAAALYPVEGTVSLTYPYAILSGVTAVRRSAQELFSVIAGKGGQEQLRRAGFRGANGKAGPAISETNGLSAAEPARIPEPAPADGVRLLKALTLVLRPPRVLLLIDTSGSMKDQVPGTKQTRMQAAAKLAEEGLGRLPADAQAGLWTFATGYGSVVPIGPLAQQRDRITAALRRLQPKGDTALYDSVLAAFRSAGGEPMTIIVLTDGRNDNAGGSSLESLRGALGKEFDAESPVNIVAIGYGKGVDAGALAAITAATNGVTRTTADWGEARGEFLSAIARRACLPECRNSP